MSKLSEYLSLIPKGIKNLPQILEAVTNQTKMELGYLPKQKVDVIIGRRLICATCPFMSKNAINGFEIDGKYELYETDRDDEHCIHCGCPISTRTASLDMMCGISSYNGMYNKQIPLKWDVEKFYFNQYLKNV